MIRAAFATGDGININRHFGIADRFDIYEIDVENKKYELVDTRRIDSYGVSLQHDDSLIDRLAEAIDDCNIVFSAKSGLHARELWMKSLYRVWMSNRKWHSCWTG